MDRNTVVDRCLSDIKLHVLSAELSLNGGGGGGGGGGQLICLFSELW